MQSRKLYLALGLVAVLALVASVGAESGDRKAGANDRFVGDKGDCAKGGKAFIADGGDGFRGGKAGKGGGKGDAFQGGGKGDKGGKGDAKGGRGGFGGRGGRGLSVEEIVDHIMSFDKEKTGKVTKEMLPERMQFLIARGDTNKDGALDKEEVRKLAADLARDGFRGFDGRGGPGAGFRGPGGPGGPGGFGPRDGFRPGGGPQRAVDELKLNDKSKEKAEAIVKAHQENVRKLLDLARSDLLQKMKDVLSEQEYKNFKDALERDPGPGDRFIGRDGRGPNPPPPPPPGGPRGGDLERKVDQLQKDLDALRRDLKR
jgi:hypothetical protein